MKLIFLMKDYSVIESNNIEKHYKNIQFILFPADEELNTYILVEPNQYMLKMKKAKIIIESVAERCGYDYRDHHHPIGRIEKFVYTYPELIQYLFSIDKIKYYNNIMMMSDVSDIPPYMKMMFCFFSVRLYDNNNHIIFKKKINVGEEVELSEIYISKIFGPVNILNNISDIYFQELSLFKEHISIDPNYMKWDFGHSKFKYSLCAYWLDETNSITFFYKDDLKKLDKISSLYASSNIFRSKYANPDIVTWNLSEYDLLYVESQHVVEYIIYLPYINLIMKTCTKVANIKPGMMEINENDLTIHTHIELEINHKAISRRFRDSDPFTIGDLMDLLEED